MTFLEIRGLAKRYGSQVALDGLDLAVPRGSRTVVVGPSGCGKTTLLRLIAGFDRPDFGRISLDGRVLAEGPRGIPPHKRGVGIVTQDGALFPHLDVERNIAFGLARDCPDRQERVARLMDMVELPKGLLHRRPHELSGGQQQRVAIARALARDPKLLLFDEPFSSLDAGLRDSLRRSMVSVLKASGATAVFVTHDQREALAFADQLAVVLAGRVAQTGAPAEVYLRPTDRATAMFLGDALILPAQIDNGRALCALGSLPVSGAAASGEVEIMLRPEQVSLGPDSNSASGVVAIIRTLEFEGFASEILLELVAAPSSGPRLLRLKHASATVAGPGGRVRLQVSGEAHILPKQ